MSKYKNLPRCPWCGYMMRPRKFTPNGAGYEAYYRCTNCGIPHMYTPKAQKRQRARHTKQRQVLSAIRGIGN